METSLLPVMAAKYSFWLAVTAFEQRAITAVSRRLGFFGLLLPKNPTKPNDGCFVFVCCFMVCLMLYWLTWRCHHGRRWTAKCKPLLGTNGLLAGRGLYRATLVGFWGLGPPQLSRLTRQEMFTMSSQLCCAR